MDTRKKNDANQANTNLRSNYPEEVVTRRHRVRASQGCLARIVELDQRSQFKENPNSQSLGAEKLRRKVHAQTNGRSRSSARSISAYEKHQVSV